MGGADTAAPVALDEVRRAGRRDPQSKSRHIEACLGAPVGYVKSAGFDAWDFRNEALSEVSLEHLDVSTTLLGRRLQAPLLIAPMTGGTVQGLAFNRMLAAAAQRFGLAMGVGSQRVALEQPELEQYFRIRDVAPDIPLFANLGAGQLARGWGAAHALRAVRMIGADAVFIHFNAVQEAVQGGDRDFRGLASRLSTLCRELGQEGVPVFAREVCFGLSEGAARRLVECGVRGLDCAGAGGTSWAKVEAFCATDPRRRELGLRFGEWGIPTADAICQVRAVAPRIPLVATGGLGNGIDLAKAIALGADVGGMARAMLLRADQGEAALHAFIAEVIHELKICMFGAGAADLTALRGTLMAAAERRT